MLLLHACGCMKRVDKQSSRGREELGRDGLYNEICGVPSGGSEIETKSHHVMLPPVGIPFLEPAYALYVSARAYLSSIY